MNERFSLNKKIIMSAVVIILITALVFLITFGLITGKIGSFFEKFGQIVAPITTGLIIAYLSNPIINFFEKRIFKWIHHFKLKRFLSTLFAFLLILFFISIILLLLVPSIIDTLVSFIETYIVNYEQAIHDWVLSFNSTLDRFSFLDSVTRLEPESTIAWIKTNFPWIEDISEGDIGALLPNITDSISQNITSIFNHMMSFGSSLFNFVQCVFLGVFIAFYAQMSKERCKAYFRRLLNSFLSPKSVRSVIRFGKLVDRSFGGFIEGQLLDAIVVGLLSFAVFVIFKIPVPHLLATIIGTTNIIPIFGPFIGGIPAAFIVLLTAPEKTILFIILIIVIQQIDGNLICPHIIGDKINISSLATIIAIVIMGGLFGILGMLIGVPFFAVIINVINTYSMNSLRRKGLRTSLKDYYVGNTDNLQITKRSYKDKVKSLFKKSTKKNKKTEETTEK